MKLDIYICMERIQLIFTFQHLRSLMHALFDIVTIFPSVDIAYG
jgi:hypothetical protein